MSFFNRIFSDRRNKSKEAPKKPESSIVIPEAPTAEYARLLQFTQRLNSLLLEDRFLARSDYKQLIDNLRVYSLYPYFLSKEYRDTAKKELKKVDWTKQPRKAKVLYSTPLPFLRIRQFVFRIGSAGKQWIKKHL